MGFLGTEPQSRISGTVARWHDFCLSDRYQTVKSPQTTALRPWHFHLYLSPFLHRYPNIAVSMHKAVGLHRNYSATSDVSSRSDPDSATWAAVAHPRTPCAPGFNAASSRQPMEYKPPRLTSTELAHLSYLQTGAYPMANAFTRESATRFDDKRHMEDDPEEDEGGAPSGRGSSGSEDGGGGCPEEDSDDDACVPDSFCNSYNAHALLQVG